MEQIKIGEWVVIPNRFIIKNNKEEISIKPLSMKILCCLLENNQDVVNKDDLVEQCWNGKFVSDDAIRQAVKDLRDYLGCSGYKSKYIETVRGEGYRLIPSVKKFKSKPESNINKNIIFSLIVITTIIFSFVYAYPQKSEIDNSYKLSKNPIIITHNDKREMDYEKNKNGWNVFTVLKDGDSFGESILIRNSLNKIIHTIYPSNKGGHLSSPTFNDSGSKLAYIDYHPNNCFIKIIDVIKNETVEKVSCSKSDYLVALEWYSESEIYFSTSTDTSLPLSMHYYNIDTKEHHKSTSPIMGGRGDYFARTCGTDLLILRNVDFITTDVIVFDTLNKKETKVKHLDNYIISIDWMPDCKNAVLFKEGQGIYNLSIESGKLTLIDENIRNVKTLSVFEDSLYVSIGNFFNKEIVFLDKNPLIKESSIISSNGNNTNFIKSSINEDFTFVSTRTGNSQLWINKNNQLEQLTNFENSISFNSIMWSLDNKYIYFAESNNIWSINLFNNSIEKLYKSKGVIRSLATINKGDIFYSSYENGLWQGFKLDILKNNSTPLSNLSIKEFKTNKFNELYFSLQNDDVYKFNIESKEHFILTTKPNNSSDWNVSDNILHYISDGKLIKKDIKSNTTNTIINTNKMGESFFYDNLKGFYLEKDKSGLIDVKKFNFIVNNV
jgi:DNA-binding winged helix-turn-helix (wHTH) protein